PAGGCPPRRGPRAGASGKPWAPGHPSNALVAGARGRACRVNGMRRVDGMHTLGAQGRELPREACMEADRVVEAQVRRVPPSLLVGLAFGSMALSAAFAVAGKHKVATFIGQWVPSLLILATFDRLLQGEAGAEERVSRALPNGVIGSST